MRLDRAQRRHLRPTRTRTPDRGRCGRDRRSSRSRPGPSARKPSAVGGRALDRRRRHDVARRDAGTARATPTRRARRGRAVARRRRTAPGLPSRQRGAERGDVRVGSARAPRAGESGSPGTRRPAPMADRMRSTPCCRTRRGRGSSPTSRHRRPATAGRATVSPAGRTRTVRRSGRPSKGSTTAQMPVGVERVEVGSDVREPREQATTDDGEGVQEPQRRVTPYSRCAVRAVGGARGLPSRRAGLRRGRDRAARRAVGPRPRVPDRRRAADGRARACSGCPSPRSTAAEVRDLTTLCIAIEELARVDHSMAITLEAGVGLGANPIHRFGTEDAEAAVAARPVRRPRPRRVRPHRARGRKRRRRDADEGRARRGDGRVGDRRREGVHHQLGHTDHVRSSR